MRDEMLLYYERELSFLRRMGAEFAERYPKVASRLQLETNKCEDPHVERLIESFAFLAARVHLKIDDQFPEITEGLFQILYPHYVRPIPSMSLVQFHLDPEQGKLTTGYRIPRDVQLFSRPVNGAPCRFRTCQETVLWPVSVTEAQWTTVERIHPAIKAPDSVAALRVELRCQAESFSTLSLDSLRLYLSGDGNLAYSLHELLLNNCRQILVRDLDPQTRRPNLTLPGSVIRQAGLEEEEAMLPYPRRSFRGYRLLQEYFAMPQKFLFLDLGGFAKLREAGFGNAAELIFLISPFERAERHFTLESSVGKDTLRTGCSTIVNLFPQVSEPILLDQRKPEYLIVPDARRRQSTEIFSVEDVTGVLGGKRDVVPFEPFYAYRHELTGGTDRTFWYGTRRPSGWASDGGTDVYLTLADLSNRPVRPEADSITCRLLCFNRDLPARLPFGNENGDLEIETGGPIRRIVCLVKPTSVVQPPLGGALQWRLISQLSLNYLSLVDGGVDALREILRINNFSGAAYADKQISGVTAVSSKPSMLQIASENGVSFVRGRRVEINLDEEQFTGGGAFLFSSVLERFLGLYTSLNSFIVLTARTQQRRNPLKEWPPRAGDRVVV